MPAFELRPLSLGELLDRAFLLYRRNFRFFAGIMVFPVCLIIPTQFLYLRSRGTPLPWIRASTTHHYGAFSAVSILTAELAYALCFAALTYASADAYLGQCGTIRDAYRKIVRQLWKIAGLWVLVWLRIAGWVLLILSPLLAIGIALSLTILKNFPAEKFVPLMILALGIIPLAWASMRYAVSLPALLLEDLEIRVAIRRSVDLTQGRRGQVFLAWMLAFAVSYATSMTLRGPLYLLARIMGIQGHAPTWLEMSLSVAGPMGGILSGPLTMLVFVLFYYDLRIRKEGYDLFNQMASIPEPNSIAPGAAASG